jgi:hypothetical protein
MKFLKSEVFRLFTLGFAAGAMIIGAPLGAALARTGLSHSHGAPLG